MTKSVFPYFTLGTIVRGFGRGSKELNCPTANLDDSAVDRLPVEIDEGVYYGWAQIVRPENRTIYKMVASVGMNPFYHGEKKTLEAHLIHRFDQDFYGEKLKIILLGKLRPMKNFPNLGEFLVAIENDLNQARSILDEKESRQFLNDEYFP